MSNGTKILIAILIIAAITVGIVGAVNTTAKKENKKDGELDEILNYINKTENNSDVENNNVENEIQENVIEENTTIENTVGSNKLQNDIVGKEEEDSNKENTEAQNRQKAIQMANKTDIIVLAGKGHEPYQEINGVKHPFDERIIVNDIISKINKKGKN